MTRQKKQRITTERVVLEKTPKKKERLTDPDSYESRKQAALKKRKKKLSVYEKARREDAQASRNDAAGKRGARKLGPLAEKIKRLNAKKQSTETTQED